MKKVTLVQQRTSTPTIILDDDSSDLLEYTKKLSNMLLSDNIVILEATSGCFILRPHQITSASVEDLDKKGKKVKKKEDVKLVVKEQQKESEKPKEQVIKGEAGTISDA